MLASVFIDNQIMIFNWIWLGKMLANDIQFAKVFLHQNFVLTVHTICTVHNYVASMVQSFTIYHENYEVTHTFMLQFLNEQP